MRIAETRGEKQLAEQTMRAMTSGKAAQQYNLTRDTSASDSPPVDEARDGNGGTAGYRIVYGTTRYVCVFVSFFRATPCRSSTLFSPVFSVRVLCTYPPGSHRTGYTLGLFLLPFSFVLRYTRQNCGTYHERKSPGRRSKNRPTHHTTKN